VICHAPREREAIDSVALPHGEMTYSAGGCWKSWRDTLHSQASPFGGPRSFHSRKLRRIGGSRTAPRIPPRRARGVAARSGARVQRAGARVQEDAPMRAGGGSGRDGGASAGSDAGSGRGGAGDSGGGAGKRGGVCGSAERGLQRRVRRTSRDGGTPTVIGVRWTSRICSARRRGGRWFWRSCAAACSRGASSRTARSPGPTATSRVPTPCGLRSRRSEDRPRNAGQSPAGILRPRPTRNRHARLSPGVVAGFVSRVLSSRWVTPA
jgi:hypothetical protein